MGNAMKFRTKLLIICLITALLLAGFDVLSFDKNYSMPIAELTYSDTYLTHMDGPDWIVPLIEKVNTRDDSHALLLGDSVCRQMFLELADINEDVTVAPAIAPFSMAGQYVLTKLYLDAHPEATDVYLIMVPMDDISVNFNIEYAYQYVVMPLVETGYLDMLDKDTVDELEYLYGAAFMNEDVVRRIDDSGLNRKLYLNYIKTYKKNDYRHSLEDSVYVKYLKKIRKMCDERSVTFHFMPAPVPDMEAYHEIVEVKAPLYFEQTGLDELVPDYLNEVRYYPEDWFYDGVHFGGKYENQDTYNMIINEMYKDSGLLESIKLR